MHPILFWLVSCSVCAESGVAPIQKFWLFNVAARIKACIAPSMKDTDPAGQSDLLSLTTDKRADILDSIRVKLVAGIMSPSQSLANTHSLSASLPPQTRSSMTISSQRCSALRRFSRYFASYLLSRPAVRVGSSGSHLACSLHSRLSASRSLTNDEKRLCATMGVPCLVRMRSSNTTHPRACEPTSDQPRMRISRAKMSGVDEGDDARRVRRRAPVEEVLRRRSRLAWLGEREEEVSVETGSEMREDGALSSEALSASSSEPPSAGLAAGTTPSSCENRAWRGDMSGLVGSEAEPSRACVSSSPKTGLLAALSCNGGSAVDAIGGETAGEAYSEPPLLLLASVCGCTTPDALACLRLPCSTTGSAFAWLNSMVGVGRRKDGKSILDLTLSVVDAPSVGESISDPS